MLTIDATALSGGFDSTTYIADFLEGLTKDSQDFYGGTPDSAFGGTYYMNGSQVLTRYTEGEGEEAPLSPSAVIMDGTEIAYDFIHHGASYGHGITGELDSLVFGSWVDGTTEGEQGTGAAGRITGFDEQVTIDGFDIDVEPGSGSDTATNAVYAIYSALGSGDAETLNNIIGTYDLKMLGTDADDVMKGSGGSDVLVGNKSADDLRGGWGDDTLRGGMGNDVLIGSKGDDLLIGSWGNDRLFGGDGDDVVIGGRGRDRVTGGEGSDTFVIKSDANLDIITDFTIGEDVIDVSDLGLGSLDDFAMSGGANRTILTDGDVTIRLLGIANADVTDDMFIF